MENSSETFNSQQIQVPPAFEKVFTYFYTAVNKSKQVVSKTLFPSFQTIMVFSFGTTITFSSRQGTDIEIEKVMIIGPVKQPIDYTLAPGAEILVANFQPGAFHNFFGQAILSTEAVHPDELLGDNCFSSLWNILKNNGHNQSRVNFILKFCEPYLNENTDTLEKIINFTKGPAFNPVKTIARETQQSERNIQLKYKKFLGYSAKEAGRHQRFLKAIEMLEDKAIFGKQKENDWFEIIEKCGYYDQSQLIHDFKHFLNLSPTQYLKFQNEICIARAE